MMTVWVYDRNVTKRVRTVYGEMETRYRIAAKVELSKERGAQHIDLVNVDSRYKGKNLAVKIYKFLMKKMDITLITVQVIGWWSLYLEQTQQGT